MKNLLFIFTISLLFIGCSIKKEIISPLIEVKKDKKIEDVNLEVIKEKKVVQREIKDEFTTIENMDIDLNVKKIAIIFPSNKIGRYANSTINTVNAFLIHNNEAFQLETFDTYTENYRSIITQLGLLKQKGFTKVIAMFTKDGFDILNNLDGIENIDFYFPLINKEEVLRYENNFIFGGISYKEQLNLLKHLSNHKNTMFYIKSYLGDKLRKNYQQTFANPGVIKEIERANNRYKYIMNDGRIKGSTVILNTPIVKSSIILSQLTAFDVYPYRVLSTQLNYDPLLIKLTQARDRDNLFVVSSISEIDNFIEEYTKLLGSNVTYEWVDYSTLLGVNYFINENNSELIKTKIIENQVDYEQKLYKGTIYGFEEVFSN